MKEGYSFKIGIKIPPNGANALYVTTSTQANAFGSLFHLYLWPMIESDASSEKQWFIGKELSSFCDPITDDGKSETTKNWAKGCHIFNLESGKYFLDIVPIDISEDADTWKTCVGIVAAGY